MHPPVLLRHLLTTCLVLALAGCASLGYYAQSIGGHLDLLARRVPIERVLADPGTDTGLRDKLELVQRLRGFAHADLLLPDNGSYTSYTALDRSHPVWTVFATPEFSLEPLQWCFPVVGCLAYRGYFDQGAARSFATGLEADGHDVHVAGATAYSTLGWFRDPVVSSMLDWPDTILARVIFHELAHQKIYVPGDVAFNEAFATAVGHAGVLRWLAAHDPASLHAYRQRHGHEQAVLALVADARWQLRELYARDMEEGRKRAAKAAALAGLQRDYGQLKTARGMSDRFDPWLAGDLDNARLNALNTYHELAPAFAGLLRDCGGDLQRFYAAVGRIGKMEKGLRPAALAGGCA